MIKLSATVITYNEENNIERCLDSLKNIADEIIIVDSYSTDNTETICKKYNTTFIKHAFEGHIEQKNYAAAQTNYDYIISLDADEVVSEKLKEEILAIKENFTKDGYYLNRLTNYCGQWIYHCGWYPDHKLRIWKKDQGEWQGKNPHDKLTLQKKATTGTLKGHLLHYSFHTISEHIHQINFFTDISSKEAFKKGNKSSFLHILFRPPIKFLTDFIIKKGMLDGYYGWLICTLSAYAKFLKYIKIKNLYRQSNTKSP